MTMPNREWKLLSPAQKAAVQRCIDKARREAGRHSEETAEGEGYAYALDGHRIAWGWNGKFNSFCIARGTVPR
jgi:hypothetical protein